jgi:site-specific recombinase XerD
VESYFNDHLRRVRGASPHTVRAYGHALRLFFLFLESQLRRPVSALGLDDIVVDKVLAFLDHIEVTRRNLAATRNCRLAAIRGFVGHLLRHDLSRAEQYRRILAIRAKRAVQRALDYLEPEHVRVLLDQPDRRSPAGLRDHVLRVNYSCRCATTRLAGPGQEDGRRGDRAMSEVSGHRVAPVVCCR